MSDVWDETVWGEEDEDDQEASRGCALPPPGQKSNATCAGRMRRCRVAASVPGCHAPWANGALPWLACRRSTLPPSPLLRCTRELLQELVPSHEQLFFLIDASPDMLQPCGLQDSEVRPEWVQS